MCGGLSVLGDVWKSEAYKLAQHINKEKAVIPDNILSKPPSAELRPNQSDADELPDYSLLDPFLEEIIEERKTLPSSTSTTLSIEEKEKVYGLIERAEWKRFQAPPVLRISHKAFGGGRRIPIVKRRS
jgi:NAD+ synthase (glutamine-hydrolysing)